MKKLFCLLIAFSLFHISRAQCAVSKSTGNTSVAYYNKTEEIYQNEDLEVGLNSYRVRCVIQKFNDSNVPNNYTLDCYHSVTGYYGSEGQIVPRELMIKFNDGTPSLIIKAVTTDNVPSKNGVRIKEYSFYLDKGSVDALKKRINSIVIIDTRNDRRVETRPYEYLLKEQLECLEASSTKK